MWPQKTELSCFPNLPTPKLNCNTHDFCLVWPAQSTMNMLLSSDSSIANVRMEITICETSYDEQGLLGNISAISVPLGVDKTRISDSIALCNWNPIKRQYKSLMVGAFCSQPSLRVLMGNLTDGISLAELLPSQ